MKKIDVCLNVLGKPYQTIVTLKSLLKHSGQHIDKIYLIEELKQTKDYDFELIKKELGYENLERFQPKFHLWINFTKLDMVYRNEDYRLSLRYEYGLEKTDKSHMLLIHNDVLFKSDIVGELLKEDENLFGIGSVGQCWNCPLFLESICDGNKLEKNIENLNYQDVMVFVDKRKETRTYIQVRSQINKQKPLPMPECRINEWCMLINVDLYKKEVLEKNEVVPFGGYFQMDIGDLWFRQMVDKGYKFKNFEITKHLTHAYFTDTKNGHSSLFNNDKYLSEEKDAKKYLEENFKK